jgi:hypothetical protein
VAEPAPSVALQWSPAPARTAAPRRNRWWVWTLVGVAVAGVAAGAVTVGLVESQAQSPRAGSLGLVDGRR